MKIIKLSQSEDREAFLDFRRGKISGSKAKNLKMLSRGSDRTPAGFYEVLAEKLAIGKDGEPERERGLRLEREAVELTARKLKLKIDCDPGVWVSDEDEDMMVSPDAAEPGKKPSYAVEAKCLDSKNHLQGIVQDIRAKKLDNYSLIESLRIGRSDFRWQAIQYFVINDGLNTLYFALYDDRFAHEKLMHYVITIHRKDIEDEIETQRQEQRQLLADMRTIIKELIS